MLSFPNAAPGKTLVVMEQVILATQKEAEERVSRQSLVSQSTFLGYHEARQTLLLSCGTMEQEMEEIELWEGEVDYVIQLGDRHTCNLID